MVYTTEAGIPTLLDGLTLDDFTAGIMITLPFGDNKIMYTAFDGCDNIAEDMFVITIVDNTSPQAICEGNTVVSLNEDGTAYAPATVFDDGSYDDCSDVEILVQRESICDCPAPTFDGLNFLGTYDNAAGDTLTRPDSFITYAYPNSGVYNVTMVPEYRANVPLPRCPYRDTIRVFVDTVRADFTVDTYRRGPKAVCAEIQRQLNSGENVPA